MNPYASPREPIDTDAIAEFNRSTTRGRADYYARTGNRVDTYEQRTADSQKSQRYKARKKEQP